jgi:hypothetical protein
MSRELVQDAGPAKDESESPQEVYCGNGEIEAPEKCDDGNNAIG